MPKGTNTRYVIKSVSSENTNALESLLNEMAQGGWDLYSMHEVETDDGFQYNCIFTTEAKEEGIEEEEVVNITTFRSQMEKMLSPNLSPYESCKEIQDKIKEQRKKISKIKSQLEAQSEAPVSKNRQSLNEEMSKGLKVLEDLRQTLLKTISPESMFSRIAQEKLSIHLSEEALDLVNPDVGAPLIAQTVKTRQKVTDELGYVIPKIVFEDDVKLSAYEFSIKVRGVEAVNSFVYPNYLMFFKDELKLDKQQKGIIQAVDEITGQKIVWIEEKKTKSFWQNGLNAAEYVARLLEHTIIKYIEELLDYSDINQYMEIVGDKNMFLIENIIPDFVSVAELKYLLASLLREGISIKDIVYIFEKINDFSDESSKEDLYDKLRLSLSRYVSKKMADDYNVIHALEMSEATYKKIFSKLKSDETVVRIEGAKIEKITKSILQKAKNLNIDLGNIVIITPLEIRHLTFIILSQFISNIKVIAREEVSNDYTIEVLDEV